jgi:hypothetical protein
LRMGKLLGFDRSYEVGLSKNH